MNTFKLRYRLDKFKYSNKRKSGTKSILFSILAIIVSLFIALIITCVIYQKASLFTGVIKYIFITPFTGSTYSDTISTISIFAVAAVAFLVASKAGLFNIGISGQMMFGGVVATIIAPHVVGIPDGLCQIFLLIMCVLGATFIASIIGVLKAFINVNEVVSSIMFNWIIYFVGIMLLVKFGPVTSGATVTNALATISPHLVMQMSLNGIYVA
jgi:simple sugar transport system permease protein